MLAISQVHQSNIITQQSQLIFLLNTLNEFVTDSFSSDLFSYMTVWCIETISFLYSFKIATTCHTNLMKIQCSTNYHKKKSSIIVNKIREAEKPHEAYSYRNHWAFNSTKKKCGITSM